MTDYIDPELARMLRSSDASDPSRPYVSEAARSLVGSQLAAPADRWYVPSGSVPVPGAGTGAPMPSAPQLGRGTPRIPGAELAHIMSVLGDLAAGGDAVALANIVDALRQFVPTDDLTGTGSPDRVGGGWHGPQRRGADGGDISGTSGDPRGRFGRDRLGLVSGGGFFAGLLNWLVGGEPGAGTSADAGGRSSADTRSMDAGVRHPFDAGDGRTDAGRGARTDARTSAGHDAGRDAGTDASAGSTDAGAQSGEGGTQSNTNDRTTTTRNPIGLDGHEAVSTSTTSTEQSGSVTITTTVTETHVEDQSGNTVTVPRNSVEAEELADRAAANNRAASGGGGGQIGDPDSEGGSPEWAAIAWAMLPPYLRQQHVPPRARMTAGPGANYGPDRRDPFSAQSVSLPPIPVGDPSREGYEQVGGGIPPFAGAFGPGGRPPPPGLADRLSALAYAAALARK